MICKIKDEHNNEYSSYVFAYIEKEQYKSAVVVFNYENTALEYRRMYSVTPYINRHVFITDTDDSLFISKEIDGEHKHEKIVIKGYDWLVSDLSLLEQLKAGQGVSADITAKAKCINETLVDTEWHAVVNKKDVANLLSAAYGFHDGRLNEISYISTERTSSKTAVIKFNECWDCSIEFVLEGDSLIHFNCPTPDLDPMFNANVFFDKGGAVCWIDDFFDDIDDMEDLEDIDSSFNYFRADSLKWRIIID